MASPRRYILVLSALFAATCFCGIPKSTRAADVHFYPNTTGEHPTASETNRLLIEGNIIAENDARTNLNSIVDAMVYIHQNAGSGNIYFHSKRGALPTIYCIDRPLRVLPNISMWAVRNDGSTLPGPTLINGKWILSDGTEAANPNGPNLPDATIVTIKNWQTTNSNFLAPVLFGGWGGVDENLDKSGCDENGNPNNTSRVTFRRVINSDVNYNGDGRIQVWSDDLDDVAVGDEIEILSGSNSYEIQYDDNNNIIAELTRPDYMIKAYVKNTTTDANGNHWLILNRTLPFPFPVTDPSKAIKQWGANNDDKQHHPVVAFGRPAWTIVKEWYNDNNPDYWAPGHVGYNKYLALGEKWAKGWTTSNCHFKDLTLQSVGNVAIGAGPWGDSSFDNCVLKGQRCLFFNACQDTEFTNVTCEFWDTAGEFSYNSYHCTLNYITAKYNSGLMPASWTKGLSKGGLLALKENSRNFSVDNLTITATARDTIDLSNSMIRVQGSYNVFGATGPITLTAPTLGVRMFLEVIPQNNNAEPPAYVKFLNTTAKMNGHAPNNSLIDISGRSHDVTISDTEFTDAPNNPVPSCNWELKDSSVYNLELGPGLKMPGKLDVQVTIGGTNIVYYLNSSFASQTGYPNIKNNGAQGTGLSSFNWALEP